MDPKAMYKLSYGLFVVTTFSDGKFNGCISNTAIQVANDPTRLGLAINKANLTHDMIKEAGKFNVSIISEEADFELFKHFGMQSGRDVDKFLGYKDCAGAANGIPYITKGTNAVMCCTVTEMFDLGSHTFFVATIDDMIVLSDADSATYTYYQTSIKPQPGKPADPADGAVWRCKICGYEYKEKDGDPANGIAPGTKFEDLPEDWVCPLCKHPKSDFEKVQ
ncbi:MAG: rubredoxin [Firmicutes bacterium]|nr:rubredoxin [Bacillota bacterium]